MIMLMRRERNMFFFIVIGTGVCSWLLIGFVARCLLKNFVYEMRKRYGGEGDPSAKELWKQRVGREQYRIIFKGYFGLAEVEDILKVAAYKKDNDGNFLKWEDKFTL